MNEATPFFDHRPSTMVPAPLITGTVIYAIIGAALCALTFGALVTGKLSKDNAA